MFGYRNFSSKEGNSFFLILLSQIAADLEPAIVAFLLTSQFSQSCACGPCQTHGILLLRMNCFKAKVIFISFFFVYASFSENQGPLFSLGHKIFNIGAFGQMVYHMEHSKPPMFFSTVYRNIQCSTVYLTAHKRIFSRLHSISSFYSHLKNLALVLLILCLFCFFLSFTGRLEVCKSYLSTKELKFPTGIAGAGPGPGRAG